VRNDLGVLALFTPGERLELVPLRLEYARTRLASGADHARIVERLRSAARASGADLRLVGGRLVLRTPAGIGPTRDGA
jgi:hypothetical protein